MKVAWEDDDVTANCGVSLLCPDAGCTGYMELYSEEKRKQSEFRVDELLVVPVVCNKCGWGASVHFKMRTP